MDVLVPRTVTVEVEVGDRVRAGETILGRLPLEAPSEAPSEAPKEAISQDLSS